MSKNPLQQGRRHHLPTMLTHTSRVAHVAYNVLALYGAAPLPGQKGAHRHLGQLFANGIKALVVVDSPNRVTGASMLKKACKLRDSLTGGWHKVVLIGWNFEATIGNSIEALRDRRLEVLQIPLTLLERLQKPGAAAALKRRVCFASLRHQSITVKLMTRTQFLPDADELLIVTLDNYVPLSPNAAAPANPGKLAALMHCEPLDLIEYWAVDPNYDGELFRPSWQHWRSNTALQGDVRRVATQAVLSLPPQPGPRRICVRALDVFGLTAELVATIAAPLLPS